MEKWSFQEDSVLIDLYGVRGLQWVTVSHILDTKSAHQCAKRWHNALRPGINNRPFTTFEHDAVRRSYSEHGPRWGRICSAIPGRTPEMIKASLEQTQAELERIRVQMSIERLLN
ncbi:317_t:CDS:2 [Paraglomus brasilianum]|uniref:317_t:CDS:1 n=1 Tax=Paraglomus brasilianum TaxID=144538 RepID=A0A9N8ZXQ8_9GLOM|nr:317_t:CDS:2 [Paraglomus brasilianum]